MLTKLTSEDELKDYLKEFFNMRHDWSFRKKKYRSESKARDPFLLCLDNIELMIMNDSDKEFSKFLSELYDDCQDLNILLTSNQYMGELANHLTPERRIIGPLSNHAAARLFLSRCGHLENDHLVDFILLDARYPYQKIVDTALKRPRFNMLQQEKRMFCEFEQSRDLTAEQQISLRNSVRRMISAHSQGEVAGQVEFLAQHEMFVHLAGNPMLLTMIGAQCNSQNFSQVDENQNSLIYIYENIKKKQQVNIETFGEGYSLNISFESSTSTAIEMLRQHSEQNIEVLQYLGCLPNGIHAKQLNQILGRPVDENLKKLHQVQFTEVSRGNPLDGEEFSDDDDFHKLTPYLAQYIEHQLSCQRLKQREFFENICRFYKQILEDNYKVIGCEEGIKEEALLLGTKPALNRIDSKAQPQNKMHYLQNKVRSTTSLNKQESQKKHVFESMLSEIHNIEHCLQYFIDYCQKELNRNHDWPFKGQFYETIREPIVVTIYDIVEFF